MKTRVVEAIYRDPEFTANQHEIVFFTNEDQWWCVITKKQDGSIVIKRLERDPFGKLFYYPNIPVITEYASEEGRFQLSLIWDKELDMNFILEVQLFLIPMLYSTGYNDNIQFAVQY